MPQQTYDIITIRESIFYFFGVLGIVIFKFLSWIMPKTAKFVWESVINKMRAFQAENNKDIIEEQKKMISAIDHLKKSVETYKNQKHKIEGELLELQDAIIHNDSEKIAILQTIYLERKRKNEIEELKKKII